MSLAYDWVDVPEGRARFVGSVRGGDDYGHSVFAVDFGGRVAFGEVEATYAGNDVSTEIINFGYARPEAIGDRVGRATYSLSDAAAIERIVRDMVAAIVKRSSNVDKPSVLSKTAPARVTGAVAFRAGWIHTADVTTGVRA